MATSTEVKIYRNPKKVGKAVVREIRNIIAESPQMFNIAISGGKTPQALFKLLADKYRDTISWNRLHFWWVDERCVAPDDNDSNFKLANDLLFSKIDIQEENIHRIRGEDDPEKEAIRYAAEIEQHLNYRGESPVFDIIILGVGKDGHTASIFPDRLSLMDDQRICMVTEQPHTGQKRITLTGRVIKNANRIFFIVTGEGKSKRISEIMNNEESAKLLPAYYIEPQKGSLIWFLDEPAASRIS